MDSSSAGVIFKVALFEVIPETLAVMVVDPSATGVATPFVPDVLLIVATPVSDESQVTNDVKSCVVLSVNVPVAMKCTIVPMGIVVLVGVVAIDVSTAGVTVSVADDEVTESNIAVMAVDPTSTAVARPVLLIVATVVLDELQIADAVRSCVLPQPVVPVAVNCCVVPLAILAFPGATAIVDTWDEVSVAEPEVTPSKVAVMAAEPLLFGVAVASPFEPGVSLTVAIAGDDDVHVANDVKSCVGVGVLTRVRVPVAANCWVVPGAMHGGLTGLTVIELTCDVVSVVVPVIPPETALMTVVPVTVMAVASP
jgi:hypothetical protein